LSSFLSHTGGINEICWRKTGDCIASASDDMTVGLWDVQSGKNIRFFKGHTNHVFTVDFSLSGNILASAGYDESVKLWDIRTHACIRTIAAHSEPITSVRFNLQDGCSFVTSSYDSLIRVWDLKTGQCLKSIQEQGLKPVVFATWTPSYEFLLCLYQDSVIRLWDPLTSGVYRSYSGHLNKSNAATAAFSCTKDYSRIVAGSEDGIPRVWDLDSQEVVAELSGQHPPSSLVLSVDSHPDGIHLATGDNHSPDPSINIWKAIY
jgi:COMPASS component SWD3